MPSASDRPDPLAPPQRIDPAGRAQPPEPRPGMLGPDTTVPRGTMRECCVQIPAGFWNVDPVTKMCRQRAVVILWMGCDNAEHIAPYPVCKYHRAPAEAAMPWKCNWCLKDGHGADMIVHRREEIT